MTNKQKQYVRLHIREPMIQRHMPEVLIIEAESFEFPWLEEDFIRCLRQPNCDSMVAEHDNQTVGFIIYELCKNRIQIPNFAVALEWRRQGIGTQMINKIIDKLSAQRRTRITLEVPESNLPAQLFFRANGFRAESVLRNFYEVAHEDAYMMQYRLRKPSTKESFAPINRISRLA